MADTTNMIKFYRGKLATLPEVGVLGHMYITTDEGAIYYGTGEGMKRLGDFIQVADVASLPTGGANQSALYYCVAENVLAKWNGSSWSQINKDTGMTSVTVAGEGNAVTAAEYDANTRKLTLTKGATYATPAVVDSKIATAVGTLGNDADGNAYANVKAYVDAKTAGIATDAALGELQGRVDAAEDAIEDLQTWVGGSSVSGQIDAKITALDLANTYEAKGAAAAVQADLDEYKGTNNTAVAAAKKAGDDAQTAVDELADKVGEVPENKTVVQMISDAQTAATYNDSEVRGLIAANSEAIETLEGTHGTDKQALEAAIALKADKSVVDGIVADYLKGADKTELQGNIDKKADATALQAIADDYLKAADKTELEGKITAEENARKAADEALAARLVEVETFFATAEGETLDTALDTLVEIQKYITEDGSAADGMVKDITANTEAIADLEEEIGAPADGETEATGLYKVIADADKALSDRIDDIHTHDNKDVLDGITAAKVAAWDAAQVNVIETVKVNGEALTITDKAVNITVGALASKDEVAKADLNADLVAEIEAKAVASDVTAELAKKADATDLQAVSTELTQYKDAHAGDYTNAQIDAAIKVVADDVAALGNTYATDAELATAVEEVKTDAANKDAVVLAEAQKGINAVQAAIDTYKSSNDTAVAGKADKATTLAGYGITDAMTAADIIAMLTWDSF